ncbi:hypothetical protein [Agrococcus jejuensis]|uniref:Uncharacterized protein n=1 Tax=Agrococcus jejuensis TaxID=399736 RepID=A0A1G8D6Q9_9MICO|nr:hypothetical protein [Agrococcus jejuensis]SDH53039.1 hypothetical protein SAMN04489720_1526 [Agrococcus jejuensis]
MASTALEQHPQTRPIAVHEHGWATESQHATSEGVVRYVRCAGCGSRRVDVEPAGAAPPMAASAVVGP